MRILKLSIGNAVLQQRHMPYIAVSAGLIHTMQFHLPRTVATVLNQGLGYGFNLKIKCFYENHDFCMPLLYCFPSPGKICNITDLPEFL